MKKNSVAWENTRVGHICQILTNYCFISSRSYSTNPNQFAFVSSTSLKTFLETMSRNNCHKAWRFRQNHSYVIRYFWGNIFLYC